MNIKELVKGNRVRFLYYRKGELWYEVIVISNCDKPIPIFTFPVPISDTGDGTFQSEDTAIFFMRWIKKQLDEVEKEKK